MHIQRLVHDLWNTRCEALHKQQDSTLNKKRHTELNGEIDNIYKSLPKSLRVLPQSDAAFFLMGKQKAKQYRIKKKEQWVEDAHRIHNAFLGNLSVEATNFLDYFDGTA